MTPFPAKDVCPTADQDAVLHPPDAVRGRRRARSSPPATAQHMPPEAAVGRRLPAGRDRGVQRRRRRRLGAVRGAQRRRERVARLQPQGGLLDRGDPDQRAVAATSRRARRRSPTRPAARAAGSRPGSSNFANEGVDQAVSPGAVVVGVQLGATGSRSRSPSACRRTPATSSTRAPPTGFYGSELMAQASLQWSPAYCLDKKRFKFQLNQMSDEAGWNLMESGGGAAAVRLLAARATRRRPGRLRADRGDRLLDRLRHRPAGQRGRVHRPQAEPAAGRQAADPVLPRLRPRPRPPGHRRQPARRS